MKAQQNARLGFIRFVAPDQTIWRHTLKGAWLQFSKGFRGSLAEAERQKDRSSIKRPGAD
jgi:hypothetical protein